MNLLRRSQPFRNKPQPWAFPNAYNPLSAGLIFATLFNENGGLIIRDSSFLNNNGSWNGTPTWNQTEFGSAVTNFTDSNYIGNFTSNFPSGATPVTMSCLFRCTASLAGSQVYCSFGTNTAGGSFALFNGSNAMGWTVRQDSGNDSGRNIASQDTKWHLASLVFPNGGTQLSNILYYFDGVSGLDTTSFNSLTVSMNRANGPFYIGRYSAVTGDAAPNIQVAAVWVWNRALTPAEQSMHYVDLFSMFKYRGNQRTPLSANILVSVSDSISLSDAAPTYSSPLKLAFTDFLSLSDAIIKSANLQLTISDTETLSDSIALLLAPIANLNLTDSITLTDAIATQLNSVFLALNVNVSDALNLLDAVNSTYEQGLLFNDSLILSDSVCVVLQSTLRSYVRRYLNDVV